MKNLLQETEKAATERFDGHLTIMRFTTGCGVLLCVYCGWTYDPEEEKPQGFQTTLF